MVQALGALPLPRLSFQVNNRKLIQGFYRGLGIPDVTAAIRQIDKLDKLPADTVAGLLVDDAGATPEQAQRCLDLATIRVSDSSLVERVKALGVTDDLLDRGLAELSAVLEGCADVVGRPGHGRGQPPHRPRARLLHRHGRRDLHGGLRAAEVGRWRRTLRRARRRRAYDVPGRRHLVRRLAHPAAADRRGRPERQPCGAERRPGRPRRRGEPTRQRTDRRRAPPPRHRLRGGAPPPEVRPSDPRRRAAGHPVRVVPCPGDGTTAPTRSRTSAPATRSTPTPPRGRHPTPTSVPRSSRRRSTSPSATPDPQETSS